MVWLIFLILSTLKVPDSALQYSWRLVGWFGFIFFFLLLFPCCCLSQWSSEITGNCSHHGVRGSEEHSAQGWFLLHPVIKQLRLCSVGWTGSHNQKSALNPEEPGWPLLQAGKNWEKPVGNQSSHPSDPQVHSQFNKRLQHSEYQMVIFNSAWALQWLSNSDF